MSALFLLPGCPSQYACNCGLLTVLCSSVSPWQMQKQRARSLLRSQQLLQPRNWGVGPVSCENVKFQGIGFMKERRENASNYTFKGTGSPGESCVSWVEKGVQRVWRSGESPPGTSSNGKSYWANTSEKIQEDGWLGLGFNNHWPKY